LNDNKGISALHLNQVDACGRKFYLNAFAREFPFKNESSGRIVSPELVATWPCAVDREKPL